MAFDRDVLAGAEALAVEIFNEKTLAGLALAVVEAGGAVHETYLGLADASARRPVGVDTVFRIGSISKTITAIAVMQLVERGAVRLDDPVNEHLRAFRIEHRRPDALPVTIRHLLTHTAGIGELRGWADVLRPTIGLGVPAGRSVPPLADYYAPSLRAESRRS